MMMVVLNMSTVILNLTLRKGTVHTHEVLVNLNNLILKFEHLLYYVYMYIIGMNDIISPPSAPSPSPPPPPPPLLSQIGQISLLDHGL